MFLMLSFLTGILGGVLGGALVLALMRKEQPVKPGEDPSKPSEKASRPSEKAQVHEIDIDKYFKSFDALLDRVFGSVGTFWTRSVTTTIHITCGWCGRKNRLPRGVKDVKCGFCKTPFAKSKEN